MPPAAGSALLIGALSVTGSLLAGAVIAWQLGILDFNPSREPRGSRGSGSSGGALSPAGSPGASPDQVMQTCPRVPASELPRLQYQPAAF